MGNECNKAAQKERDIVMAYSEKFSQVDEWETHMLLYNAALKEIRTRIDILSDELCHVKGYTPIEHVKSRIKSSQSIVKKLKRNGLEANVENMAQYVKDVAGIRIICSFTSDIYKIAEMISNQSDVRVIQIKDYIASPKPNGYKSYHMVVAIPVFLSDGAVETKVEIQIRTIAMDFWATLEHKIYYKFEGNAPDHIRVDLKDCADIVEMLDARMLSLNEAVQSFRMNCFILESKGKNS